MSNELLPNLVALLLEKSNRKLSKINNVEILNPEIEYKLMQWVRFIIVINPKNVRIQKCLSKENENSKKSKPDKTEKLKNSNPKVKNLYIQTRNQLSKF